MEVYIAEKPDIASAIASFLWKDARQYRKNHYFQNGDVYVTWSFGHILESAMPDAYGEKYKSFTEYPLFPSKWIKKPSKAAVEQFRAIESLLSKADVVIHGGDPDREGQLLVDEIINYVGYKGKVNRILINAKDDASLKRAFEGIVPDSDFLNLYKAGMARERADWLVGINLSRAYSVNAQRAGVHGTWKIGRVKVPTLALVVNREREIKNFKVKDYYILTATYTKNGIPFMATYVPSDSTPQDSEGRIINKKYLEEIVKEVTGKPSKVVLCEKKPCKEYAPLPYSLDTLQVEANRRFGLSPAAVLATVQSLYEKKIVSYPRSDCNYIPTSQHIDAKRILSSIGKYGIKGTEEADIRIKGKGFNDSKISAHHAIIPTGVVPSSLDGNEKTIYEMIATRYLIQFYPCHEYYQLRYEIECSGHKFAGTGKCTTNIGWKKIYREEEKQKDAEETRSTLPPVALNDIYPTAKYNISSKKTQPPKRFTEGTLLAAMTNIWRFISPDNPNREKLKECKGIGTPATRDTIISELLATKSGKSSVEPCLKKFKKELIPTEFGCYLIDNIDDTLTKPDFTAIMEYSLSLVESGKKSLDSFMKEMEELVRRNISYAENKTFPLSQEATMEFAQRLLNENTPSHLCPVCHKETLVRRYSKTTQRPFWVCSDKQCVHSTDKSTMYYEDNNGFPLIKKCSCGLPAKMIYSKEKNKKYYKCIKCNRWL